MQARRLILEFEETPDDQEIKELYDLAHKLRATITPSPGDASHTDPWQPLILPTAKRPLDISNLAVKEVEISSLITLFSEEASAEELCKLLD